MAHSGGLGHRNSPRRPTDDPPHGLVKHADILKEKILRDDSWKPADKEAMRKILETTGMFSVDKIDDTECLAYLRKVATANAQNLEERTKRERGRYWRTHVAGAGGECARGAYQYAKGPVGTQASPTFEDDEHDTMHDSPADDVGLMASRTRLPHDVIIRKGIAKAPTRTDVGEFNDKTASPWCSHCPASLQQAVDKETEGWAALWKVTEHV